MDLRIAILAALDDLRERADAARARGDYDAAAAYSSSVVIVREHMEVADETAALDPVVALV